MTRRPLVAITALLAMAAHSYAADEAEPQVPCGNRVPVPAYASAGSPEPVTWTNLEWNPPSCLGWAKGRYRFVAAIAGSIHADDTQLKRRLGAISTLRGVRYWSVTENAWRELIKDSSALSSAEGPRRADFAPEEIRSGAVLHFVEEDNRSSSPVAYRMHVVEASADRILVETENATPVEANMITLYPPGALRAAYFLTKLDATTWGLYAVSASTSQASRLVSLARESHANRARALFAHYAGTQ
jgi:hypothetical protein